MRAPNRWKWIVGAVASALMSVAAVANNPVTQLATLVDNPALTANIGAPPAQIGDCLGTDLTGFQVVSENSLKLVLDSGQLAFQNGGATGVCPATAITTKNYAAKKNSDTIALGAPDNVNGPAQNDTANITLADKNGHVNTDNVVDYTLASGLIGQKVEVSALMGSLVINANANNTDATWTTPNSNLGGANGLAFTGAAPNIGQDANFSAFADTLATHTGTAPPANVWV